MDENTRDVFRWNDWDWRALTRLVVWLLLAALWARWRGVPLWSNIAACLRDCALLCLLSFGAFTYLFALIAMGAIRAALFLDEAAYAFSERLTRSFSGAAPFAVRFWTAFGAEIALVLGAAWIWRACLLGPRVATAVMEVLR